MYNNLTEMVMDVADAIREKDGTSALILSQDFGDRIRAIPTSGSGSSGSWTRPSDRPAVPEIGKTEQVIWLLFGVSEFSPNDYAIQITTSAGQYRAEWGDGTQNDYDSNTKAEHLYDYTNITVAVSSENVKWVWIKIYSLTGDLTGVQINVRHSLRPAGSSSNIFVPQIYEWYMRGSEIISFPFSGMTYTFYKLCDIFYFYGTNHITSFAYCFYGWINLKSLILDTSAGNSFNGFMRECFSFNSPLNIDTSNGDDFSDFMRYCYSFNQPLNIDTSNGIWFYYCLQLCYSFNQPLNINTSKADAISGLLYQCYSFNQPLNINTSVCTDISDFMANCNSYSHGLTLDLAINTNNQLSFSYLYALKSLRLLNMKFAQTSIDISGTNLDVPALVALFGDLSDRTATTAGTITITKAYGAARLTPAQRTIAANKNWTITG